MKKMSKTNIYKIILIVSFLQFFATGCVKYCRNVMTSSSDENHVTMVMQGGYNKCFIQTDITPKANRSCNMFGKKAIYTGQRRIHRQLLYVDYICKRNGPVHNNQQNLKNEPKMPDDLIFIQPGEAL